MNTDLAQLFRVAANPDGIVSHSPRLPLLGRKDVATTMTYEHVLNHAARVLEVPQPRCEP